MILKFCTPAFFFQRGHPAGLVGYGAPDWLTIFAVSYIMDMIAQLQTFSL